MRLVTSTIALVLALFVFGQVLFRAAEASGSGEAPPQPPALDRDPAPRDGFGGGQTVIARNASGRFHLAALVNGEEVEFLVDTGADVVALTVTDAERLGLDVAPDDFRPILQTASGVGNAARVRLDRIALGDAEFPGVDAVVVEGLEVNLLGQSVLRRLGKVELQGDTMVIAHR